jgi:hypothetical protein
LRYSVDWQDDAINAAPEERAAVADLRLWLNEQNVCMHLRGSKPFDHITISLYALAEGLAHDWWTLFGGRDYCHSLINYRSGYAVPDIRLSHDGGRFEISSSQLVYANPDIRFWSGPVEVMTRGGAEAQLTEFIECVLDRLTSRAVENTSASLRWSRVKASREDPEEAAFCEAAGALRLDPYQLDEAATRSIELASGLFEGEPLTEFLAGARAMDRFALIDWVEGVERRATDKSRVADLHHVATEVAARVPDRVHEEGWARGYRRARALRKLLGFDQTRRFDTFQHLAEAVGASPRYELAPSAFGIRLLRSHVGEEAHLHMRTHGRSNEAEASHLFTFARGIGDVVCFPAPERVPVNDLHAAYRQATGRAFAAEFLAPVNEILSMQADGRDAVAIAETFAVSAEVIERQIENAQRIEAACV